ncbi:MAG: T9SS type A sorting domain-containing protein [Ignavibacteriaceae bacterium]|nr:T9SS type A sorting domain-containing protein [Ignavibacteriaceae bacterium]
MKTLHKSLFLIILLYSFLNGQTAVAPAGSGTSGDPYRIATWQNLYWISQNSAQWNKYYIQTADIDFTTADPAINTWASGAGWTPIGNASTAFTGSYNGQGYVIKGLYISRGSEQYIGLFGYITGNGSATIANLFIQGTISGANSVGALVGNITNSNVSITNCHSNSTVTSSKTTLDSFADTGGLIGIIASGTPTITNCSSSGSVTGQGLRNVGGLLGYLNSGTVQKSFSTANVINSASNQGNTGGFIGGINSNGNNTLIEECFATGNVSGGTNNNGTEWRNGIGGFIGTKRTEYNGYTKTIRNCYSIGVVSQTGTSTDIGGFIGRFATNYASSVSPTITNCYWDTQRSTQASSAGGAGTGLTTANMKVQGSFTSWDFTNTWKMSSSITYDGYPTLEWAKGYSTEPTSNQIAGLNNLVYVAENSSRWATSYTQTGNVNAWWTCGWDYQKGWTPIGRFVNGSDYTSYSGTYNGGEYTISNLYINRTSVGAAQALFGLLHGGTVIKLGVINANITGYQYCGILVGYLWGGSVTKSYVSGSVNATFIAGGGIVGLSSWGTISNSYSTAQVTGLQSIGGFVGINTNGNIQNCFSIGSVTGGSNLGGLVGVYNSGGVTNSFWDTQTSGRATSGAGTGKTSEELKTASTFTDAGWDFYGESGNGTDEIWNINETRNNNYPFLTWQYPDESPLPVDLTSFTASVNKNKVVLNWQTATEQNNHGFEIERISNNENWEKIAFVNGNGNSNSPKTYSFTDESLSFGKYSYRLKQIDNDGSFTYSESVEIEIENIPTEYTLYQNYPNPFNPSTTIKFGLPKDSKVILEVYNIIGEKVTTLINQEMSAGYHNVNFTGSELSTGIYIYRITANEFTSTKKFILMK